MASTMEETLPCLWNEAGLWNVLLLPEGTVDTVSSGSRDEWHRDLALLVLPMHLNLVGVADRVAARHAMSRGS